ncbi:MAG TPA: hypothetical protein VKT78_20760 [Fimbriimonadaceae bacterium]|nr:hypothetical protein [Fimbriimonadaceae bacterium]
MHRTSIAVTCLAAAFVLPLAATAKADVQFLGSASTGMAGAGLALPLFWNTESANPALFSYSPKSFFFQVPDIQIFTRNISYSDLQSNFGNISGGGLNSSNLATFAQTFGDNDKQFGIGADLGIGVNGFVFGASGAALVRTHPNASLQADVKSGKPIQNYNPNDSLDGYGYGYYSIDFAYGREIPYTKNAADPRVAAGLRVRAMRSYYSHQFVTGNQIIAGSTSATLSPEMGGNNTLSNNGVAADLGVHMAFGETKNYYAAAQIRNLIQPRIGVAATLPQDQTTGVIGETTVNPFATMLDLGVGATPVKGLNLALDGIDLGNRGNSQEMRAGVDYEFAKFFSVQGGYSSRNGWAAGAGIFGFTVAVSRQIPISLSYAFRF